jgi:hypothetical protein
VKAFLERPWQPETYSADQLAKLFDISVDRASRIILDCNAGDPGGETWEAWCNHHDLVTYLKDLISLSEVPQGLEDLSVHGRWLVEKGWLVDGSRTIYRWVDPKDRLSHYSLKAAISIEAGRIRKKEWLANQPLGPDVIDVEVVVRS